LKAWSWFKVINHIFWFKKIKYFSEVFFLLVFFSYFFSVFTIFICYIGNNSLYFAKYFWISNTPGYSILKQNLSSLYFCFHYFPLHLWAYEGSTKVKVFLANSACLLLLLRFFFFLVYFCSFFYCHCLFFLSFLKYLLRPDGTKSEKRIFNLLKKKIQNFSLHISNFYLRKI